MSYFTFDGMRLHYHQAGAGPLLLIFPGNTASGASHAEDLAYFSRWFTAVALDPPGTGKSDRLAFWPDDWFDLGARAGAALLDLLGADTCLALGCSGGGALALGLALERPSQVMAVMADSFVASWPGDMLQAALAGRQNPPADLEAFWRQAHGDDWADVVKADSGLLSRFAKSGLEPLAGRLGEIACPVLITASLADQELHEPARQVAEMVAGIPRCQAHLAGQGWHPLMWSRPDVFRPVARAFLEQYAA
jgi:valacyclovir hydrolase